MLEYNLIFFLVFLFVSGWSIYKIIKINPEIIISCKLINNSNRLFIVVLIFGALSLIFNWSYLDIIRLAIMFAAIILYFNIKSGLTEDGLYYNASFNSYEDIAYYDYEVKNNFKVYVKFKYQKNDNYGAALEFKIKDQEKVINFLKNKLDKKHKRIKK